jgi:integrase/recombinase XerD
MDRSIHAAVRRRALEQSSWGSYTKSQLTHSLKIRGYSDKTIRAYCGHVERFYQFYEGNREILVLDLMSKYSYSLLSSKLTHS